MADNIKTVNAGLASKFPTESSLLEIERCAVIWI
jgi:hypothetical protein